MDAMNWKILEVLQKQGRLSFADIAKTVHLSAPAVMERVKKLETAGIITGYSATVNMEKVGLPITAMVQAKVFMGKEAEFVKLATSRREVLECYNVTGEKAFHLKVAVATMSQLDALLEDFSQVSETNSMIILSVKVNNRAVTKTQAE